MLVQLVLVHGAPQRRQYFEISSPMISSLSVLEVRRLRSIVERLDQPLEVLVRLDVAGVEHERVVRADTARARAPRPLRGRRRRSARRSRCRSTSIFSGGTLKKCRMSRFELPTPSGCASTGAPRATSTPARRRSASRFGQVLRKHQVDAVVDGHDRSARTSAAAARSAARETGRASRGAGPAARTTARGSSTAADESATARKFSPSASSVGAVLAVAEQDVLGRRIDPRQMPQQVADVGADAEVVQLARIDSDSHW